jgi:hypothetical protein
MEVEVEVEMEAKEKSIKQLTTTISSSSKDLKKITETTVAKIRTELLEIVRSIHYLKSILISKWILHHRKVSIEINQ